MNYCIVPARKDSKRLAGKNLRRIRGRTLIDIALNSALSSSLFDRVILTTNIPEMLLKYKYHDRISIHERSKSLCSGSSQSSEFVQDIIDSFELKGEDTIFIMQPTSPLRRVIDIINAMKQYRSVNMPVVSLSKAGESSKMFSIDDDNTPVNTGRDIYIQDGAVYIFSVNMFKEHGMIPQDGFSPYIMEYPFNIDIDDYRDLLLSRIFSADFT
ncbi:MAG: hypothetical protein SVK54_01065 [candidate division WOR-3 bacterium]|nr:hypothetical protein [candidate division WOR-3 bacterium]